MTRRTTTGPARSWCGLLVAAALSGALAPPAAGQLRQPDSVFTLDVEVMGATVGYARSLGPGRYWGLEAGLGGSFLSRMLVAGDRFSHRTEGTGAGREDTRLMELGHVGAFHRWRLSERVTADAGVRASLFYNSGPFDDDPAFPTFAGAYATLMMGGRRLQVGPRIQAGLFAEGSGRQELGVYLVPLAGRVSFGW
jgi:hypothetical protein